jgi:hypothetical protein
LAVSIQEPPLVEDVLPRLAAVLREELLREGEPELSAQVGFLRVVQPCRCQDDFCQSFYTDDHEPGTSWGADHRTVPLRPEEAMVNVDVADGEIVQIEIIL